MPHETLSPAKRRLVDHLKRSDGATAAELAERMELTTMAIRQHLHELETAGMVVRAPAESSGRGRPAQRWTLTELADGLFPDRHADLTVSLIANIRDALGADALDRVIDARTAEQLAAYRKVVPASAPLAVRVRALAARRSEEGYEAEAVADGHGAQGGDEAWLLIENHCPVCDAARACMGLCRSELSVFEQALGPGVKVERVQHLLAGDRRCVYRITSQVPDSPRRPRRTRGRSRRRAAEG